MEYLVEYAGQNWVASDIEADSAPIEAAKLHIAQDAGQRHGEYKEVIVSWGLFGRDRETFKVDDLLPSQIPSGAGAMAVASSNAGISTKEHNGVGSI